MIVELTSIEPLKADCCQVSTTVKMQTTEFIHLKYAFKAARRATVSFASTLSIKKSPSLSRVSLERKVVGFLTSGCKALKTMSKCFLEGNLTRTRAFAFTTHSSPLSKRNKRRLKWNRREERLSGYFEAMLFLLQSASLLVPSLLPLLGCLWPLVLLLCPVLLSACTLHL